MGVASPSVDQSLITILILAESRCAGNCVLHVALPDTCTLVKLSLVTALQDP